MQKKPTQLRLAISFLCCFILSCKAGSQTAQSSDADTQAKVQKLVDKTLKHLSFIEGGNFMLGDTGPSLLGLPMTRDGDNKPAVPVTLTSYSLMQYKVTYDDFDVFVAANNLPKHPPEGDEPWQRIWRKSRISGDVPAGVNWQQAKDYCTWLGKVTHLPFDLPTEAQWEYAARNRVSLMGINAPKEKFKSDAGKPIPEPIVPTDNGLIEAGRNLPNFAWKEEHIKGGVLYAVGQFPPSTLGLYDMSSNGFDWVDDWYAPSYTDLANQVNPKGVKTGTEKVLRGRSNSDSYFPFPHIYRNHIEPTNKSLDGEPLFYDEQNARCALNQTAPVTSPNVQN